jgi:hypothetical protein
VYKLLLITARKGQQPPQTVPDALRTGAAAGRRRSAQQPSKPSSRSTMPDLARIIDHRRARNSAGGLLARRRPQRRDSWVSMPLLLADRSRQIKTRTHRSVVTQIRPRPEATSLDHHSHNVRPLTLAAPDPDPIPVTVPVPIPSRGPNPQPRSRSRSRPPKPAATSSASCPVQPPPPGPRPPAPGPARPDPPCPAATPDHLTLPR